jgi:hypothetical protein
MPVKAGEHVGKCAAIDDFHDDNYGDNDVS